MNPQTTGNIRELIPKTPQRWRHFLYNCLLIHGDRNQFDEIVQETFAHAKESRQSPLLLTLLDMTSGRTREEIITYVYDTRAMTYSSQCWEKCAENPPEHLRQAILSHILKEVGTIVDSA